MLASGQAFPFDPKQCKDKQIVIIQRNRRLILNVDDLKQAAFSMGYNNTIVIDLEDMTVQEQYQLIRCTRILIGINGAGLQWGMFMPPKSGLIELSFNKPKFGQTFADMRKHCRKLTYDSVKASYVAPDFEFIAKFSNGGKPFTDKEKKDMLSGKKAMSWKYANGEFDPGTFKSQLKKLADSIFR